MLKNVFFAGEIPALTEDAEGNLKGGFTALAGTDDGDFQNKCHNQCIYGPPSGRNDCTNDCSAACTTGSGTTKGGGTSKTGTGTGTGIAPAGFAPGLMLF